MSTAIEINHVGKQYRLGLVSARTLSHDVSRWWQTSVLGKEDPYLKSTPHPSWPHGTLSSGSLSGYWIGGFGESVSFAASRSMLRSVSGLDTVEDVLAESFESTTV